MVPVRTRPLRLQLALASDTEAISAGSLGPNSRFAARTLMEDPGGSHVHDAPAGQALVRRKFVPLAPSQNEVCRIGSADVGAQAFEIVAASFVRDHYAPSCRCPWTSPLVECPGIRCGPWGDKYCAAKEDPARWTPGSSTLADSVPLRASAESETRAAPGKRS